MALRIIIDVVKVVWIHPGSQFCIKELHTDGL